MRRTESLFVVPDRIPDYKNIGANFFKGTRIKSPVRPEFVEGLAEPIDYYGFNQIMVRQTQGERI